MDKNLRNEQGVYAVIVTDKNTDTDYMYIGSGKLGDRISGNASKLRRGVHENRELQAAYNSFNNVKCDILQVCVDEESARDTENEYIEYFKKVDGVIICNKYKAVTSQPYRIKLDEDKVRQIRQLIADGKSNKEIAEYYGVANCEISKIKTGLRWTWVV